MGRTLNEIIADLPRERQETIEERYQELKQEVESTRGLRPIDGAAQTYITGTLNVKPPSV